MTARVNIQRLHVNRRINDLKPGESGWTVPWAVHIRPDGAAFINADSCLEDKAHGTLCVRITRERHGYVLDLSHANDYGWTLDNHASGTPVAEAP